MVKKTFETNEWLEFLIDYMPYTVELSEIMYEVKERTYQLVVRQLSGSFDLRMLERLDGHNSYTLFLCYCSYVGHGISLESEFPKLARVLELDVLLQVPPIVEPDEDVLSAKRTLSRLHRLISDIESAIEERVGKDGYSVQDMDGIILGLCRDFLDGLEE